MCLAAPPDQGRTEGPRVQPQGWSAAAFEEPVAAFRPDLNRSTGHQRAELAVLSKASEDLCNPAKAAFNLSKTNGTMQNIVADCCWISLTASSGSCLTKALRKRGTWAWVDFGSDGHKIICIPPDGQ